MPNTPPPSEWLTGLPESSVWASSADSDPTQIATEMGQADAKALKERGSFWGRLFRVNGPHTHEQLAPGRRLRRAVRAQDLQEVRHLIDEGIGLNDEQEASLACIAARRRNLDLLRLLIGAGVDPNKPDRRSKRAKARSPLQECARKGWLEGMAYLVSLGVNLDAAEDGDATAMHMAARLNQQEAVQLLLDHGASPDGAPRAFSTPLHDTANTEIVAMLIQAGARMMSRDRNLDTPLHIQIFRAHPANVALLLWGGAKADRRDRKGRPPLFLLGSHGNRGDMIAIYRMFETGRGPSVGADFFEVLEKEKARTENEEGDGQGSVCQDNEIAISVSSDVDAKQESSHDQAASGQSSSGEGKDNEATPKTRAFKERNPTVRVPWSPGDRDAADNSLAHAWAYRVHDEGGFALLRALARDTGPGTPGRWMWEATNAQGLTPVGVLINRGRVQWAEILATDVASNTPSVEKQAAHAG